MEPRQLRQDLQLRRVDRHVRASCQQLRTLARDVLLFHQKRDRLTPGVQRAADDQRTFRHEQAVFRVCPVHKLVFRQSGIDIQLRRMKIGNFPQLHHSVPLNIKSKSVVL